MPVRWLFLFLTAFAAAQTPFRFVAIGDTGSASPAPALELRDAIAKSLHDYHVQFVLGGHNHFYSRMKPVDGLMQMISGGGGRHLAFPRNDKCAVMSARKYEFLEVEVFADRVRFIAIDEDGKTFDDFTADEKYLSVSAPGCPIR
jgi:hypothetical protein